METPSEPHGKYDQVPTTWRPRTGWLCLLYFVNTLKNHFKINWTRDQAWTNLKQIQAKRIRREGVIRLKLFRRPPVGGLERVSWVFGDSIEEDAQKYCVRFEVYVLKFTFWGLKFGVWSLRLGTESGRIGYHELAAIPEWLIYHCRNEPRWVMITYLLVKACSSKPVCDWAKANINEQEIRTISRNDFFIGVGISN